LLVAAGLIATAAPATEAGWSQIDPADFSSTITNPHFPLSSIRSKTFIGTTTDDEGAAVETRLDSRVLTAKERVAGIEVLVLEERAYEDGELVEVALDYFAQHRNGDVYYFGERVDNYEDGAFKDNHGQWLAGQNGAEPGIIMPAVPVVGKTYQQEFAPGVAEDKATVLSVADTVSVPAGAYSGCLKTRDFTPLEPGISETKWHCPGVGMVREEGDGSLNQLVSVELAPAATPTPPAPTPTVPAASPPAAPAASPVAIVPPATGNGGLEEAAGWAPFAGGLAVLAGILGSVFIVQRSRRRNER
jgi:hypothetical protein